MTLRLLRYRVVLVLLTLLLGGCGAVTAASQPPDEYLSNSLDWIESHSVLAGKVDFPAVRQDALAFAQAAKVTTDTHAAIRRALAGTGDALGWLYSPQDPVDNFDAGLFVALPQLVVTDVAPGGPAERGGVRAGDLLVAVNGAPPRPANGNPASYGVDLGRDRRVRLSLQREGQAAPFEVTLELVPIKPYAVLSGNPSGRLIAGAHRVGYLDLVMDPGGVGPYPDRVQRLMRTLDAEPVCGWIIDLRHNTGGDIWTYIAALGPLLGEGDVGGFLYAHGERDVWSYGGGKVFWNDEARGESFVQSGIYTPHNPGAPVALLTSFNTIAAGELVVVVFEGRPDVKVFGEPTRGLARLVDHTSLSDGAELFVSGAYAMDRAGKTYEGPIQPDELVKTDWTKYGTDEDPVIRAAAGYLADRPGCR